MMQFRTITAAAAALMLVSGSALADRYIVMANGNKLPNRLDTEIRQAGGSITARLPQIGIAIAESDEPDFAQRAGGIRGLRSVFGDIRVQWLDPDERRVDLQDHPDNPPNSGDDDFFFDLQWHLDAIDAPEAWHTASVAPAFASRCSTAASTRRIRTWPRT